MRALVSLLLLALLSCRTSVARLAEIQAAGFQPTPETEFQAEARKQKCRDDGLVQQKTPLIAQENVFWCWAASAQMVEGFYGNTVKQCEIANDGCAIKQLTCSGSDCCGLSADCCIAQTSCQVGGYPPFERRKIDFKKDPGPLTAAQIVYELGCAKRPFVFEWVYKDRSGHLMIAAGYQTVDGKDFLIVKDPWPPPPVGGPPPGGGDESPMSFDTFKLGTFKHGDDYYRLVKKP